ncbi:MAG: tRNA pseudouridine(38-40) synthase TruA [Candidatus Omnitrophota bacterium]
MRQKNVPTSRQNRRLSGCRPSASDAGVHKKREVGIPTERKRASARNLKLEIEYDGTNYAGWQVQNSNKTIQSVIEKTLQRILQEKVHLIVSGRTDSGTHALAQVANFKTKSKIPPDKLRLALNSWLPADIAISKAEEKALDFHSRFDAKSKIYRYSILNRPHPSPLQRKAVYFYRHPLNVSLMRKESKVLLGRHNFKSFQAVDKTERNPVRTIKNIRITVDNGLVCIDIEAGGFLYNMVRNIAGTLIEIGRGRFKPGDLKRILLGRDRRLAGPTVPARGLCLMKVNY